MDNTILKVPIPQNETVRDYAPGSMDRAELKRALQTLSTQQIEIPLIIGGREIRTGDLGECVCPHDHRHVLARYHKAGQKEIEFAVEESRKAWKSWSRWDWGTRASVFLKAAEVIAARRRYEANATAMLNLSKNPYEAEIDSACETIDFLRFNVHFMNEIYQDQPLSERGIWDYYEYRPLEGFIFAVTPFNFAAIASNLPSSPAMMGNVCLWKPASSAVLTGYFTMRIFMEAGLPPGVINFMPGAGSLVGDKVLSFPSLAGIHFTGGTTTFSNMWRTIGADIRKFDSYPRIVGETGGKGFVFLHASADVEAAVAALIRGAFGYQGQKCSAASRLYVPESLWPKIKEMLIDQIKSIRMGDVMDFRNMMNAVIDKSAFTTIRSYIDYARHSADAEILTGGECDDSIGYFIEPTVVRTLDPKFKLMKDEIFGPVLTLFVYPDDDYEKMLAICDETSPYALTGSIFADDRRAVMAAYRILRYTAGNFYINDKPTGAVVGKQPFGGGRASGTNDKSGSQTNLMRWVNIRAVKETFNPARSYQYPFMAEE